MSDTMQKVSLAVAAPMLLALCWFLFGKAKMVWVHVDQETPISRQESGAADTRRLAENTKQVTDSSLYKVAAAVDALTEQTAELKRESREIRAMPLKGQVSREVGSAGEPQAGVFLNSYSDARRFRREKKLLIRYDGKEIEIDVAGTITNPDDRVIGKLNGVAADQLGVSERMGIAMVTIRRIMEEPE